jgi:hypothetical protein
MIGHEDIRRLGQPGHATCPGYSPTLEVSSGSPADGQPHLEALARSIGLRH